MKDGKYYVDYGQIGARVQHDTTRTNWWVALPGCKPIYMTEYKPFQYKEGYKPVNNMGYIPTHNKEAHNPIYKTDYVKPTQCKKEYQSVSKNAGHKTGENKSTNCKKKISFRTQ